MNGSENKIALITGGSRGLGRNTVLSLARRGVSSIFTYNTNQEEADKVVNLVAETRQKAIALRLDAGNTSAFDPFVLRVREALASLGQGSWTTWLTTPARPITRHSLKRLKTSWMGSIKSISKAYSS